MARSVSASEVQPIAEKRVFEFAEYVDGGKALSVQMDIRDMAAYYAEDSRLEGGYERSWSSCGGSEMIPREVHNAEQAIEAVRGYQFPLEVRHEARRHARSFASVFADVMARETLRHQVSGRLDRRKLDSVAMHTSAGTYKAEVVRPYRRTVSQPVKPPTVAVVASAGNGEMWHDAGYIPRVVKLTLALLWGAEASGLAVYGALTQGHSDVKQREYAHAIQGIMLAKPGERVSPSAYAVGLHRDLWRYGLWTTRTADYEGARKLARLGRDKVTAECAPRWFSSYGGGRGVNWARAVLGADVVISIGYLQDRDEADIKLRSDFSLEDAVKDVVKQAKSLKSKQDARAK